MLLLFFPLVISLGDSYHGFVHLVARFAILLLTLYPVTSTAKKFTKINFVMIKYFVNFLLKSLIIHEANT